MSEMSKHYDAFLAWVAEGLPKDPPNPEELKHLVEPVGGESGDADLHMRALRQVIEDEGKW